MAILGMALLVFLLFLTQRWLYQKFWDKGLSLKLSFSAREAFEGETLVLQEELTNAKLLPLPWVTAKFQLSRNLRFPDSQTHRVSDDYYQSDLFSINLYQRITRSQEFICARRGYYRIKSADLASSNIFISQKLVRRVESRAQLTVFPKLIPMEELSVLYRQLYGDIETRRFTNPDAFSFRGIREYGPRDDFRLINFKATAKTGQLMVNVSGATASQELVILLNVEPYSQWSSDDVLEEGIRIAASAAERFCAMGLSVGILSNGRDTVTLAPAHILPGSGERHLHSVLERLARIDLSAGQDPFSQTMQGITESGPVYLLISSHFSADIRDAFAWMRESGFSVRWILPFDGGADIRMEEHPDIIRWEVESDVTSAGLYPNHSD